MNHPETKQAAERHFKTIYSGTGTFTLLSADKQVEIPIGDERITNEIRDELNEYIDKALAAMETELADAQQEIERIKQNHGCARYQGTTQFCAEAVAARKELADAERSAEDARADSRRLDWLLATEGSIAAMSKHWRRLEPPLDSKKRKDSRIGGRLAIDAAMSAAADGLAADGRADGV